MNVRSIFLSLLVTVPLVASGGWARPSARQCGPEEKMLIDAEARCVEGGGIDIGFLGDDGAKVACLQSKRVQSLCGPDGRVTRLHAYTLWMNRLQKFQAACESSGGTFAFEDPSFTEPQNEAFCLQAQPEVGSDMFETQLCNYRSLCPAVAVVCDHSCKGEKITLDDTDLTTQSALSPFLPSAATR